MSEVERELEIKNVLHFCHLLAENPDYIAEHEFLEKFLDNCYEATVGCNCKRKNNIKKLEKKFLSVYQNLEEEDKKNVEGLFGEMYTTVFLILSNQEKLKLK